MTQWARVKFAETAEDRVSVFLPLALLVGLLLSGVSAVHATASSSGRGARPLLAPAIAGQRESGARRSHASPLHLWAVPPKVLEREGLSLWRTHRKPQVAKRLARHFAADLVKGRRILELALATVIDRGHRLDWFAWVAVFAPRCRTTLLMLISAKDNPQGQFLGVGGCRSQG
jgi:hypothetical protein